MAICSDCGKDVLTNYQTIETKRGSKVYICNDCVRKTQRKEVDSARDNQKLIREH